MTKNKWNYTSHVTVCWTCGGTGAIHALRRPSTNDPYPEDDCPDCDGAHEPACEVCGFHIVVPGIDCLACDTVALLHDKQLAEFGADNLEKLMIAMGRAVTAAVADQEITT